MNCTLDGTVCLAARGVAVRRDLVAKKSLGLFLRPHDDSIFAISSIIK